MGYRDELEEWKRIYWWHLLAGVDWNVAEASRVSGVNRSDLYKKLRALGVMRPFVARTANRGKWDRELPE